MPETPSHIDLFKFGLRVAWNVCGCDKSGTLRKFSDAFRVMGDIAKGKATLHDSPAECRNDLAAAAKWFQQQDDETSKGHLEFIQAYLPDVEDDCRRLVARDRSTALCVLKSTCKGATKE